LGTAALVHGLAAGSSRAAEIVRPGQILLQADEITYDSQGGKVTAHGHVEITDEGRTLLADDVIYDEKAGKVFASGHVSLQDQTGNVAFADKVELTRDLRQGALQGFAAMIGDNGRIAAASGERLEGRYTVAHAAVFTPCELCGDEDDRMPLWEVRASRVVHDQIEKEFYFDDATFLFMGVPVFYLPYFSQADPSVTHKSGFLLPDVGSSTYLGSFAKVPYYISLSESRDLTLSPFFTTGAGNLLQAEYRERFSNGGGLWLQGSLGYDGHASANPSRSAWISSLFGSGRIPIKNGWRAGFDVQLTSDDTFLQRYELSTADRLTTNLFADRVSGRNRFGLDMFFFQSLRSQDVPGQIPLALPLIEYTYIPEGKIVGGRLRVDTSALALSRDVGTDMVRGSVSADWRRPFTTESGQLFTFEGLARSDVYHIENAKFDVPSAPKDTQTIGRALGLGMLEWRWPFVGEAAFPDTKLVLEPIAQLVVASGGGNPDGLPDEDSTSFEFDSTNLFSPNPSPGYDLWTGGTRSNIGVRATALLPNGSIEATLGQDFRLVEDVNFAPGSGFGDTHSDTVGQIKIQFPPFLTFTEQFNISPEDGTLRRNEIYLRGNFGRTVIDFSYLKLPPSAANPTLGVQEQINLNATIAIYENWGVFAEARRDIANNAMLESGIGLKYEDECFVASFGFHRRDTSTLNLKPASAVIFRLGLKTGFTGG
jgi:LPS-assembly protein